MKESFLFYKTDDGSTGLYSNETEDIFHSKTGALKEAFEKFITPSKIKEKLESNSKLRVLDICSGIGYNLKAAISCIENNEVEFDCIEKDKTYILLSPFIEDRLNNELISIHILSQIINSGISISDISAKLNSIVNSTNLQFFSASRIDFMKFILSELYKTTSEYLNPALLHNIYYKYISHSNYNGVKPNKYKDVKINYFFDDARSVIKQLSGCYDVIFLDAFSPQKTPELWTIDFLSELKKHMYINSTLVTYSKSTPVRSALYKLNFSISKTYIDNIDMGTAASLDFNLIKNNLTEFDIGLLNTRSGIHYKDSTLSLSSETIIKNREIEQSSSDRISHTQYLKLFQK